MAVHLAVAGDVFDGVFLCCPFSQAMCWMRSGTELCKFLSVFLPTLDHIFLTSKKIEGTGVRVLLIFF